MKALILRMCAVAVSLLAANAAHADISFHLEGSVGNGGVAPIAASPQLAVDGGTDMLVLVQSNTAWAVIDGTTGSMVATALLDNTATIKSSVLFDELTGDDHPDVVVGRMEMSSGAIGQHIITVTVTLYAAPSYNQPQVIATYFGEGGLLPLAMGAIDRNFDGSANLWLSIPDGIALQLGDCRIESLDGTTMLLDLAAGDTVWTIGGYFSRFAAASNGTINWIQAVQGTAANTRCGDATGVSSTVYNPVTITDDGSLIQPFKPCPAASGGGSNNCYSFGSQFVFDLIEGDGEYNAVTIAECAYDNGGSQSLCIPEEGYDIDATVAMHSIAGPASDTREWSRPLLLMGGSVAHHSMLPDQLLVLSGDSIVALNLSNGLPTQTEPNLPTGGMYRWFWPNGVNNDPMLVAVRNDSVKWYSIDVATDIDEIDADPALPGSFVLGSPYPNPFNPTVSIPLRVARRVQLKAAVYDLLGRQVAVLFEGKAGAGDFSLTWDGTDASSGVYFVKVSAEGKSGIAKMVLLK